MQEGAATKRATKVNANNKGRTAISLYERGNTYMHVTDNMQQTVASAMGNLISEKENEQRNKRLQFPA